MKIYSHVAFWANGQMAGTIIEAEMSTPVVPGARVVQLGIPNLTKRLSELMGGPVVIVSIIEVGKADYDAWEMGEHKL